MRRLRVVLCWQDARDLRALAYLLRKPQRHVLLAAMQYVSDAQECIPRGRHSSGTKHYRIPWEGPDATSGQIRAALRRYAHTVSIPSVRPRRASEIAAVCPHKPHKLRAKYLRQNRRERKLFYQEDTLMRFVAATVHAKTFGLVTPMVFDRLLDDPIDWFVTRIARTAAQVYRGWIKIC